MRRDSGYSWVVACSCSMVVFCTLGMFRTSGLFYLELQDVFAVSRETAVWPIGIAGFGLSLFASLPGFLIAFFTLRQILFAGIALVTSGLALCFFATSTTWFTVSYGIIFATGCGLCVPTSSILMNGHFDKYRGIANSILMSGDSLALFLMTPLTTFLLKTYELRGACLIIAAIFANLYVLLRIVKPFQGTIAPKTVTNGIQSGTNHKRALISTNTKKQLVENGSKSTLKDKLREVLTTYWSVFKDPMYQICTTTQAFYSVVVVIYCIVIADYGLDQGMEKFNAVYLITVTGASELVGRATVGYITDHKFIKAKTVSAANQVFVAIILFIQTFVGNTALLHFILSCLFGLLSGCVYALGNVIYVQYLGVERLPTALSLKSFLIAILAFLRPVLIGLCRDRYGTYVYLFYILAVISLFFGLSWAFEPYIMRRRREKTDVKQREISQLIEVKI